jgi:Fe-S oxidoreductase
MNKSNMSNTLKVNTMADYIAAGKSPEILFWIGCAGSFDDRAKKITKAFVKILNSINVDFAVLGKEESCSGDPAKRAGNEFLFQMQAVSNIEILNSYDIKTIVTTCPHCFNTLKNEYPSLGGNYKVYHHTQFLKSLLNEGRLKIEGGSYKGKKITYHDPCYLGRANNEYEAPRDLIHKLEAELIEMKRCKKDGLCCGAGGAQMFKDAEKGNKEINIERTEDVKETKAEIVATGCPFCNTMLTDGAKTIEEERKISVMDISELIANAQEL